MTQIKSFHVPEGGNSLGLHTGYVRVDVEEARNSIFAKYRDAGISAIPIKVDGSKKPLVLWERFKHGSSGIPGRSCQKSLN